MAKFRTRRVKSTVKHWTPETGWETLDVKYTTHELTNHTKPVGTDMGNGCFRVSRKGGAE